MKRLFAVVAIALTMTIAAACNPDDTGTGAPGLESPSLESPAMSSPGLESIAPVVSPSAS